MSERNETLITITDLHVSAGEKEILKGVTLSLKKGEILAVMGPNGSGKSTLAHSLMGHPGYTITKGSIVFKGENVTMLSPDERARRGIFLSFQYPHEIPGVSMSNLLRHALRSKGKELSLMQFKKLLKEAAKSLHLKEEFLERNVNEGFSGGEKKRAEIFQLAVLQPEFAILDETDSGLDIDALKIVAEGVKKVADGEKAFLVITHYQRLLDYLPPHRVAIMDGGRITRIGGPELAHELERVGYGTPTEEQQ